ncbi:Mitotic-spindle organizing protein 1 [Gonapodya sp. JEL0774]|nr:Mitotic-spindle organizing protein 1 [Gonapodya sp. JEL0774]
MSALDAPNLKDARETFEILLEISRILNTGLDRSQLAACVQLCELGVNPEALAAVVKEVLAKLGYKQETKRPFNKLSE